MYRYSPYRGNRRGSRRNPTVLWLLIVCLLGVSVALGVSYFQVAGQDRDTREVLIAKVQSEASHAKTRSNMLNQSVGSGSAALVAAVRQHVYGVRLMNDLSSSIYGSGAVLVDEALVNNCVVYLDECDLKLQKGEALTQTYVSLKSAVDALFEMTERLR